MDKILKESYIYKFLIIVKNFFQKLLSGSLFVQKFLKNNYNEEYAKQSILSKLLNLFLKFIRKIARKLKFDKIFENSIFAKPLLWVSITVAMTPILPTMLDLGLVLLSFLSFVLMISIDESFEFKHYKINSWIFAFIVVVGISACISISLAESLKIAMLLIAFLLFYFIIINVIKTKKDVQRLVYILIIVATFTAIYGIYQYMFGDVYSQAWLDEEMFEDISMRVYSTLDNPNVYGEYLILMIPMIIGLLWTEKGWKRKSMLFISLCLCAIALILTFSRGCWLGIILAVAILAVIINKKFIFLGIIMLFIMPFILPESIINRFMSIGDMGDSSTSYRVYIWMGTLAMLKDYWLSGVGMGITSFNTIYPIYSYNGIIAPHAHNLYLQVLVEYGIVGFGVMAGVMFNYFKEIIISLKSKKNILLSSMMAGMFGFLLQSMTDYTWYNYRVFLMFWIIIAISVSLANINVREKDND